MTHSNYVVHPHTPTHAYAHWALQCICVNKCLNSKSTMMGVEAIPESSDIIRPGRDETQEVEALLLFASVCSLDFLFRVIFCAFVGGVRWWHVFSLSRSH